MQNSDLATSRLKEEEEEIKENEIRPNNFSKVLLKIYKKVKIKGLKKYKTNTNYYKDKGNNFNN